MLFDTLVYSFSISRRLLLGSSQSTSGVHSEQKPEVSHNGSDDEEAENEVIVVVETDDMAAPVIATEGRVSPETLPGTTDVMSEVNVVGVVVVVAFLWIQ